MTLLESNPRRFSETASAHRVLSYTPPHITLMLRLGQEGIPYISEHPIETNLVRKNGFAKNFVADILIDGKIVIEVDGKAHRTKNRTDADESRDEWLTEHGYTVLRFSNQRIKHDLDAVVQEIREQRSRLSLR